tara:strand:+ start:329 stop:451 length:123 start_codon:yes stop_codon:yes gene_type:complete
MNYYNYRQPRLEKREILIRERKIKGKVENPDKTDRYGKHI